MATNATNKATTVTKRTTAKAGSAVKKTAVSATKKVGTATKKTANKVGTATKKTANKIGDTVKKQACQACASLDRCTKGKLIKNPSQAAKKMSDDASSKERTQMREMVFHSLNVINEDINEVVEDCAERFKGWRRD